MFTGIVEEVGTVVSSGLTGTAPLHIRCRTVLCGTKIGDSIAVNGVCLTVRDQDAAGFVADVQPVTRQRSNLGALRAGDTVNLECSVAAGERLGGHYVQGHVDGVGHVVQIAGEGAATRIRLRVPDGLLRYVVERGYLSVDGASLTVAALFPDGVEVSLVYHTQQAITLPHKRPGDRVNLEVDVIAKYVERLLGSSPGGGLTIDQLRRHGFS